MDICIYVYPGLDGHNNWYVSIVQEHNLKMISFREELHIFTKCSLTKEECLFTQRLKIPAVYKKIKNYSTSKIIQG